MTSKPTTEEAPRAFAHYRVTGVIGRGGMAVVYEAANERTGAAVALKVVDDETRSEDTRARFAHEATIAGKLEHPNIVRVYDFLDEPDGASVLVMERLRGETLASLLARREKLGLVETLAIVLPLLAALDHTHRQGIVHRDVKTSNVFLAKTEDGEVVPKLLDFGIATRPLTSPHLTAEDEVLGTPRAMSPEQIRGDAVLDGRSDLFSLAGAIVEMMTARAPFEAKTAAASLVAVLERDVDPPPEIPPRVFVELERALRKRAFERHTSAAELATALRDAGGAPTPEELRAALRSLAPVEASLVATPGDSESHSPVERRPRPGMSRVTVALAALSALLVVTALYLGLREPKTEARIEVPVIAFAPLRARDTTNDVTNAQTNEPAASASTSASPAAVVPPRAVAGAKSAAPKPSSKAKPVATRPDF